MSLNDVIAQIDAEIAKLQQAKVLLSGAPASPQKAGRGRPKGSKNSAPSASKAPAAKQKSKLSPEGRAAIAEAVKKRWADKKKSATKAAAKQV